MSRKRSPNPGEGGQLSMAGGRAAHRLQPHPQVAWVGSPTGPSHRRSGLERGSDDRRRPGPGRHPRRGRARRQPRRRLVKAGQTGEPACIAAPWPSARASLPGRGAAGPVGRRRCRRAGRLAGPHQRNPMGGTPNPRSRARRQPATNWSICWPSSRRSPRGRRGPLRRRRPRRTGHDAAAPGTATLRALAHHVRHVQSGVE
ncbi:hypothetical protein MAUB1S_02884 [Mycolicibacterium aubagnense]